MSVQAVTTTSTPKSGRLHLLFSEARAVNDLYNTDIASYLESMEDTSAAFAIRML